MDDDLRNALAGIMDQLGGAVTGVLANPFVRRVASTPGSGLAYLVDCIHADDLAAILAEKGLGRGRQGSSRKST